uniref:Mucin-2-like n=1 Tax=Nicotiana sylvestris TaxID=4096 RepID=A0A1U7W871_NICSY|nr:PREDICTED: mucin-2-like [Nicotiana sylvestris]
MPCEFSSTLRNQPLVHPRRRISHAADQPRSHCPPPNDQSLHPPNTPAAEPLQSPISRPHQTRRPPATASTSPTTTNDRTTPTPSQTRRRTDPIRLELKRNKNPATTTPFSAENPADHNPNRTNRAKISVDTSFRSLRASTEFVRLSGRLSL